MLVLELILELDVSKKPEAYFPKTIILSQSSPLATTLHS